VNVANADSTSTCSENITVVAGDVVTWTANLSGSGDTVEYTWSGDEGLSGSTQTVSITYATSGSKSATASVKAVGNNTSTTCSGLSYTVSHAVNTPPVITLSGDNPQTITLGNAYVELQATAQDAEDGLIPFANFVVDISNVNTNVAGDYVVKYNVNDSNGLSATEVIRTVNVVAPANNRPVITLSGLNPQTITLGGAYVELQATAQDAEDGLIPFANFVVDISNVNTSVVGSYVVRYNVNDSQGLSAVEVVRNVDVVAPVNTKPVITLSGDNPQLIVEGDAYVEQNATAVDAEDGNITPNIVIDISDVNTNIIGDYIVTYNVVDSKGLAADEVTRSVIVTPATSATCTESITTTVPGQSVEWTTEHVPDPADPVFSWYGDDGLTGNTQTVSHVYANAGTYSGTVVVSGTSHVECNITTKINTPPTIVLNGLDPITVTVGDIFTDPGATANDIEDDIKDQLVLSTTVVDTTDTGTYILVYSITDSGGLTASVTRNVNVVPVGICLKPVISSALTASVQVNQAFSYTITVNATEPVSIIDGYSVTGLPSGLSFATTTGNPVISGTPTATGTFNIGLSATNICGATTGTLVLTVTGGGGGGGNTAPVITLIGTSTVNIIVGDTYIDAGATAFDAEDHDITSSIVRTGSVATSTVGTYTLTFNVTDSGGLSAVPVSRTIIVNPIGQCLVPDITSALKATGVKGQNFNYTIAYTPSATTTITVDNSDLPAGTTFDATTGIISGTPTVTGNFDVDIKLVNSCGETNVRIEITINEPPCTNCGGGGGGGGGGAVILPSLTIVNEKLTTVLPGAVLIGWNTNIPATSQVVYGKNSIGNPDASLPNYGYTNNTVTLTNLITSHTMGVTFEPGTTYFFRPISTEGNLKAVGRELSFTIPPVTGTCSYLRDFLRIDLVNDPIEVKKLQAYLNSFEGENLSVSGIFDTDTLGAVNRYQDKYLPQILTPWGHDSHTGYVYILTKKHINETYCKTAYPLTVLEQNEIDAYRNLLQSLRDSGAGDVILVTPEDVGNTTSPEANDGTVGVVVPEETATTTPEYIAEANAPVQGIGEAGTGRISKFAFNMAAVLFAFPDSVKDGLVCVGYLILILAIVYVIGTLLVNILSKNDVVSLEKMRMRKIASYVVGIVYAFIPVLIYEKNCLIVPLIIILAILVASFIYLWVKYRKVETI